MKLTKYYVTATDNFMSGWGKADEKINKWVIVCETREEAEKIQKKVKTRKEMTYVNIRASKPYYDETEYYTSWSKAEEITFS